MPGKDIEIAIQFRHIHRNMGNGLGPVEQHRNAVTVRQFHNLRHRVNRTQSVGLVNDRDQLGAVVEQAFVLVQQQFAVIIDGNNPQPRPLFLSQDLPGDNVGVMLHSGDDDFIAGANLLAAPGLRHQVDALGSAAHKDDFPVGGGVEQLARLFPGPFVGVSSPLAEGVHAAVDIGVFVGVVVDQRVDDRLGFLAGGGVVQIDQRLAVDGLLQDGKVRPDAGRVEGNGGSGHFRRPPESGRSRS